jgi:integrase
MKKNRKGLYETQVTINGKRKVFSAKTQIELKRKIAAYTETAEKGMLFRDVVEQWISEELPTYRPGTQKTYAPAAERAITHFGEYRITDITPGMVNAYVHTLGRSFASGTVSNSLSVVSIIFRWAMFNNLAKTNPADQVDVPTGLRKSKRPAATPEQVAIIKANTTDFGFVANLLLYTGLRLGEACALTYADIDRTAKTLTVNKQVIWEGNRPQLQTTKTSNGIRTIVIPDPLFAILPQGSPCTYIVGNELQPITRNAFRCRWLHWCRDMGMVHDKPVMRDGKPTTILEADVTPHQLRHNYATILWEAGVPPEIAQKLMGHSDIHTTQQIYLEIRGDHLSDAANALNRHLNCTK